MSYTKYTNQEFEKLADGDQINIMALFGNGVDIQLMEYLKSPHRTSYQNFYNYLCYKNFDKDNIIFQKMTEDKKENEKDRTIKQNWSDFENSLIEIFNENNYINEARLTDDFNHFQVEFSNFLNDIIGPNMLAQIGNDSSKSELAISSFQKFLADLDESNFRKLSFPSKLYHYKLFNWEILNFNYTSMLDNILVLDKEQYDPHPWPHADRQISFAANPNNFTNDYCFWDSSTYFSSYLMTNITHPHGYQNVPKSMLFGFDNEEQIKDEKKRFLAKNFLKPYWAQNDKKYKSYFNNTDLFILYGLSLGDSDFWWWNNILNSLLKTDAELIIYNYNSNNESDSDTINRFINVATNEKLDNGKLDKLHKKIAIVQYNSETKLNAFKLDNL
ncbi:AbiH family protein [Streptococcus sp. Marseille-Q0941]|uniref:AbiH family protein n=1 Tax=Streptococcus sp. Marseille-Q0941 TaxID=2942206 RepID=UPI0020740E43|nr:AbiH family protein [Streptococcus sp. Marseille-Q0941]